MLNPIISSKEARARWRDLLDTVSGRKVEVIISRNKKPIVAMIAIEDYEVLREQLEELKAARRAEEAYRAWQQDDSLARPYSVIREELIAKGLLDE